MRRANTPAAREPGANPTPSVSEVSVSEVSGLILAAVADRTGSPQDRLDVRARFSELGLDSLAVTSLTREIGEVIGLDLPPTLAWEYPTVEALAQYVAGGSKAAGQATAGSVNPVAEPVAVVGMACRFPGAGDLDAYWRLLLDGVDAVTEVPHGRWDGAALYHPDPEEPGRASTRWGGFLEGVDGFDPQFFGISPREAAHMDPQQRVMLELAWTALEDAGSDPATLRDRRIGVFTAALWNDYARLTGRRPQAIGRHTATGEDLSVIAARISYTLGLRGPSVGVTTACSGALTAMHLACQSLRDGDSEAALAGGVNLLLAPESTVAMTKFGAMSPRGRCRAFAAGADGYVRAEGGGLVVLKLLSKARADGDRVYCVIRGSALNNDGYSNGLTAPSPQAQEDMLRRAYARAGVAPHDVDYVEAHGTGTPLGDPIEAGALGRVLGAGRPDDVPLLIGSVKTNLGHLESAAGVAGLIKTALALHHRTLPPSLHFAQPSPHIDFAGLGLEVVGRARPWPQREDGTPALAGVSSFGFGGTNCHVVLEATAPEPRLLMLSAPDTTALRTLAGDLADATAGAAPGSGTAHLLAEAHRQVEPGSARSAAVVRSVPGLVAALRDAAVSEGSREKPDRLAFVFSGQGSQWAGMGRDLLREEPVFGAAVDACDRVFADLTGWSVRETLLEVDAGQLRRTEILQPLVFTVQTALVALWGSWGVHPDILLGHSLGEVAAAHASGALGLHDAARVVHHRSRLMARIDGAGAVAVVELDADRAAEAAARYGAGRVEVAGRNSPSATVLAGDPDAVEQCLTALREQAVPVHRVAMGVASHTAHCDPLLPELATELAGIRPLPPRTPLLSTVTAAPLVDGPDAGYWGRNLREPVLFADAVGRVLDDGPAMFLEVGPHPVLGRAISETAAARGLDADHVPVCASLHRDQDARTSLLTAASRLHRAGFDVAAPTPDLPGPSARAAEPRLLTLAAHSPEAARAQAGAVADLLAAAAPEAAMDAVCAAAARLRSGGRHRVAAVFRGRDDGVALLRRAAAGLPEASLRVGSAPRRPRKPAFVFSGQGTEWAGMGLGLSGREPVFRAALERYDGILRDVAGWSLLRILGTEEEHSRLPSAAVAQPALCAVQLALVELWDHWGVRPDAVAGHGSGEIAAACVAGAIGPEDALRIAVERGRVWERALGHSSQGRQREPFAAELAERLAGVRPAAGRLPFVSTVTGGEARCVDLDAAHWGRTVRHPVRFRDAVDALAGLGCDDFVEIGPHPVLTPAVVERLADRPDLRRVVVPSLRRGDDTHTPLVSRGALWAAGYPARREAVPSPAARSIRLPAYPWQRERYWVDEAPLEDGTRTEPVFQEQLEALAARLGTRPDLGEAERAALPRLLRLLSDEAERRTSDDRETAAGPAAGEQGPSAQLPRYTVRWTPLPALPAPDDGNLAGHWLLIGGQGLAEDLADRLRAAGGTVTAVRAETDDLGTALTAALDRMGGPLRGAVHLHAAQTGTGEDSMGEVTASALALVRCLAARSPADAGRLWCVTRSARPDAGAVTGPDAATGNAAAAGAALWGFGATVAQEHPALWGGVVDVDGSAPGLTADLLAAELHSAGSEDRLAFRAGARLAARLAPAAPEPGDAPVPFLDPDAAYLVTGGTGGIGLLVTRHLAGLGARRLFLAARGEPSAQARHALDEVRKTGAQVTVVRADLARRDDVERLLQLMSVEAAPLRGIVHAAGALDDGVLLQQTPQRLRHVLAGKAGGALLLDELTGGMPLDFFVFFSSFTATLGSAGQSGYTAANAVLDRIALGRRARGVPATSIGWGPWHEVGMTSGEAARQRWPERGLTPLDPQLSLRALDRALTGAAGPHELVLDVDWARYAAQLPRASAPAHLRKVLAEDHVPARSETREPRLAHQLAQARPEDHGVLLGDHVALRVAEALGMTDPRRVDREAGFFDLGLDSMDAVGLAERLSQDLGEKVKLPATTVFDHPSVAALTAYVAGLLVTAKNATHEAAAAQAYVPEADTYPAGGDHGRAQPADRYAGTGGSDTDLETLLAEIESLSEEEAIRRLAELSDD
ncbi:SDR family NAD(P)-dependent oxidoreductase [Streptomyces sp. BE230]|uniref:SDR family NAD(P)-dependent oxidoreductase n=1 Tax=Streptomyces sp. BE230 TaxID=3002526 RepID=UPI002ED2EDAB|nr:SDR family NAD(P)-dependent oxidoreductase [Streptomyces sp. BE230]